MEHNVEKYITDNGYGSSKDDATKGYSDETIKQDHESIESWDKEYEERMAYRNTGFGRDTGDAR